jgi:hypothetical protein
VRASELIAELAQCIALEGDRDVVLEIQDHDRHQPLNIRVGSLSFVTDRTYPSKPIRLVSRTMQERGQ